MISSAPLSPLRSDMKATWGQRIPGLLLLGQLKARLIADKVGYACGDGAHAQPNRTGASGANASGAAVGRCSFAEFAAAVAAAANETPSRRPAVSPPGCWSLRHCC